jgi:hypothetical protein
VVGGGKRTRRRRHGGGLGMRGVVARCCWNARFF